MDDQMRREKRLKEKVLQKVGLFEFILTSGA